jgi:hypothetical protein
LHGEKLAKKLRRKRIAQRHNWHADDRAIVISIVTGNRGIGGYANTAEYQNMIRPGGLIAGTVPGQARALDDTLESVHRGFAKQTSVRIIGQPHTGLETVAGNAIPGCIFAAKAKRRERHA